MDTKKQMYMYIIRLGDQASNNQLENVIKELHIVPGFFLGRWNKPAETGKDTNVSLTMK